MSNLLEWVRQLLQAESGNMVEKQTSKEGQGRATNPRAGKQVSAAKDIENKVPTIFVRGEYWKNTEETRLQPPEHQKNADCTSVETLVKGLARYQRAEVRMASADGLGRMGPEAINAIPDLLQSAVDVDEQVRRAALKALQSIDPDWKKNKGIQKAIPYLIEALQSSFPEVASAAYRLLVQIGPLAVPALFKAFSASNDSPGQVSIIRILGHIGPRAARTVPGLILSLRSQSVQTRIAAANALAKIGFPAEAALPALAVGLSDRFSSVREAYANCIASLGAAATPVMPALLQLLSDREERVRKAAAIALEHIGTGTIPALTQVLQSRDMERLKTFTEQAMRLSQFYIRLMQDVEWRDTYQSWKNLSWMVYEAEDELACLLTAHEMALQILGEFGPDAITALPAVVQALREPNYKVRLAAVEALDRMGPPAGKEAAELVLLLVDKNELVREAAAKAWLSINKDQIPDLEMRRSIENLVEGLCRQDTAGMLTVDALALIGSPAVPVLIEALSSQDRIVREQAALALGKIGPMADAAIPALNGALYDSSGWVRNAAERALAIIKSSKIDKTEGKK